MKKLLKPFLFAILYFLAFQADAKPKFLEKCWKKQVNALKNQCLDFHFYEKSNTLEHSFEPWQQTPWTTKGKVSINANQYVKNDTMSGSRTYYSKTQLDKNTLLFWDYGDDALFGVTKSMFQGKIIETARYSPMNLIHYFYQQKIALDKEINPAFAIYTTMINKTIVKLFIQKSNHLLTKIVTLSDDELFGDVTTTYNYKDFATINAVFYPKTISIDKINGKLKDEVTISTITIIPQMPKLLEQPKDYVLKADEEPKTDIKVEKYSSNIHFLELKHTDDKVMIVEFKDFLLVAEAPLNSKNGELIIAEATKIAPKKPIKYFVFGHYHPHYLGGLRPFVHAGAKIICSKGDEEYVKYIANAPHTLNPDILQKEPKSLLLEEIQAEKTISDGNFEMKIYFIGKKSEHTNDYLIYYFPSEKLLFEDDLVWIKREGNIKKASGRQAGLYNAVKALGLDIKTIIQSWPVADYGVKTVIPFEDLEKSMNVK